MTSSNILSPKPKAETIAGLGFRRFRVSMQDYISLSFLQPSQRSLALRSVATKSSSASWGKVFISELQRTSPMIVRGYIQKKGTRLWIPFIKDWQLPTFPQTSAVSSALKGLTSLFGMGRGEHLCYSHQNIFLKLDCVLFCFLVDFNY